MGMLPKTRSTQKTPYDIKAKKREKKESGFSVSPTSSESPDPMCLYKAPAYISSIQVHPTHLDTQSRFSDTPIQQFQIFPESIRNPF